MIIVVTGATATGKTKMGVELSKYFNGEVINADSTQIFKDLNIATAKVTEEEKENIKHHLIDIKDITEDYTVYDYQKDARKIINELLKQNKVPVLVGGTGLYIKSVLYNYEFKDEIKYDYSNYTTEELYDKLIKIDKNIDIHKNNRQRIERKLNFYDNNIEKKEEKLKLIYDDVIFIGLTTDRLNLYERINKRVDKMVLDGLIEEAKKIFDSNIRTKAVNTPIGYKELFDYFLNKCSLEESLDLIKQRSRRYAKRQYTWNKHQFNLEWFDVDYDNFNNTVNEVIKYIEGVLNEKK